MVRVAARWDHLRLDRCRSEFSRVLAGVKTMTEHAREVHGGGPWGPREAAAEWRRGAAARLQAFGPATEMMVDLVEVAEGSRVLDVGAGAGDSTLVAAQRVGSRGRVVATDVSASMLEVAAELARQAGLNNVDTRVADAQRLDLDPHSFDAAVSRNCLMLIPDYQRALINIRRVLKPGGRFAAIVFRPPTGAPISHSRRRSCFAWATSRRRRRSDSASFGLQLLAF